MVGAYGVGEVLSRLETGFATKPIDKIANARTELPTWREMLAAQGHVPALDASSAISSASFPAPARPSPRS